MRRPQRLRELSQTTATIGPEATDELDLSDDDLLAELDAEFAELTSEIDRITALPQEWAKETQIQQLTMLRDEWLKKAREKKNRPQWQAKVEEALSAAFEKVVRDGTTVDLDGKMSFKLDQQTLGKEAMPVLQALFQGLTQTLAEKVVTLNLKGTHTPRDTPTADAVQAEATSPSGESDQAPSPESGPPAGGDAASPASSPATAESAPESTEAKVQIKLDFGQILGTLFKQVASNISDKKEDD